MIELHVSEDQRIGKVVQELRTLVEEGRVVLVALDDERARGAQLKAGAEVLRHAADQERRLERRIFARGNLVNPRQHAGGGGFAVRAGDDERLAAGEELLAQQRGHRSEGNALVEHAFHFGIAARERIADDDEVGRGIEIRFGVGLQDRNAERAKQVAHGRIGRLVGAGDAMALQLQQAGQRGHGRAADAAQMNVSGRWSHCVTAGSSRRNCGFVVGVQLGLDAKGQRHVLARDVAAAQADGDRSVEVIGMREGSPLRAVPARAGRGAIEHFAEDDAAHAFELARLAQLPQHAVDLVGLGADVFEEEQFALGCGSHGVPSSETRMLRQPP